MILLQSKTSQRPRRMTIPLEACLLITWGCGVCHSLVQIGLCRQNSRLTERLTAKCCRDRKMKAVVIDLPFESFSIWRFLKARSSKARGLSWEAQEVELIEDDEWEERVSPMKKKRWGPWGWKDSSQCIYEKKPRLREDLYIKTPSVVWDGRRVVGEFQMSLSGRSWALRFQISFRKDMGKFNMLPKALP